MTKVDKKSPPAKKEKQKQPPSKKGVSTLRLEPPGVFIKKTLDSLGLKAKDAGLGTAFVTSGTNAVGYRVAMGLLGAGYDHVRVGVWKGPRQLGVPEEVGQRVALELEGRGATVLKFDWTDPDQYQMALAGVNTVFCTLPYMEASVETFARFVHDCRHAGVKHFVKTSFYSVKDRGITYEGVLPYAQFQHACDKELEKPPSTMVGDLKLPPISEGVMKHTLLRTCHLMSTPMIYQGPVLREEGKYVTASYAMGVNYISPNDVARAAIVALMDHKKHKNKVYNLTGAKPIKDADVCKLLSDFHGKDLEHVPLGYHEMENALRERKLSDFLVQDLAMAEQIKASGVEEKVAAYSKDLEIVLGGAKPETFEEYLAFKDAMTYQEFPQKTPPDDKKPEKPDPTLTDSNPDNSVEKKVEEMKVEDKSPPQEV